MYHEINLAKVKLIIWDLDDTFWSGLLSEGGITANKGNIEFVKQLTDKGIINSICSKNDFNASINKLIEFGIYDYFVFPSINWEPKGKRIGQMIDYMQLRAENVLFIDDNILNLEEAKYYSKDLLTGMPDIIDSLIEQLPLIAKDDKNHARLRQYKILEKKHRDEKFSNSNEEFLFASNIRMQICKNCIDVIDRISEMILRTNQLNYTKLRSTEEELRIVIKDETYDCAYIKVRDNYGDYGIIGFYAYKDKTLTHFLFSCRIMGMGIEQYVYSKLNCPELNVEGEVANYVNKGQAPKWIYEEEPVTTDLTKETAINFNQKGAESSILVKGPCDMEQVFQFLDLNRTTFSDKEVTFTNEKTGVSIESYNHTYHVVQALTLSEESKEKVIFEIPFSHFKLYETNLFSTQYKIVFFSLFTDPNLGLYRRKETGEYLAFGEWIYDLTNEKCWHGYINGTIFNANCHFNTQSLIDFKNRYEYLGRITVKQIIENLKFIREHMDQSTVLVLFLGSELEFKKNIQPAYADRHIYHKTLNQEVRNLINCYDNIKIIEFSNYVKQQSDYFNNINHFIKPIYYQVAKEISLLVSDQIHITVGNKSRAYLFKSSVIQKLSRSKLITQVYKHFFMRPKV